VAKASIVAPYHTHRPHHSDGLTGTGLDFL